MGTLAPISRRQVPCVYVRFRHTPVAMHVPWHKVACLLSGLGRGPHGGHLIAWAPWWHGHAWPPLTHGKKASPLCVWAPDCVRTVPGPCMLHVPKVTHNPKHVEWSWWRHTWGEGSLPIAWWHGHTWPPFHPCQQGKPIVCIMACALTAHARALCRGAHGTLRWHLSCMWGVGMHNDNCHPQ
jgi:hypothetical protein